MPRLTLHVHRKGILVCIPTHLPLLPLPWLKPAFHLLCTCPRQCAKLLLPSLRPHSDCISATLCLPQPPPLFPLVKLFTHASPFCLAHSLGNYIGNQTTSSFLYATCTQILYCLPPIVRNVTQSPHQPRSPTSRPRRLSLILSPHSPTGIQVSCKCSCLLKWPLPCERRVPLLVLNLVFFPPPQVLSSPDSVSLTGSFPSTSLLTLLT